LIKARYTEPELKRPYRVSLFLAILFCLASFLLIVIEFMSKPKSSLTAFAFIICGVPFYWLKKLHIFRKLCCFSSEFDERDCDEEEQHEEHEQVTYNTF